MSVRALVPVLLAAVSLTACAGVSPERASQNWAGYVATGGSYTGVTGTWTVPQPASMSLAGVDATWVGIGGVKSRDLIQAGTPEIMLGSGLMRYESWMELLPEVLRPIPLRLMLATH